MHFLEFTTGLSMSNIQEAFNLISTPDNHTIRKGEAALKSLQGKPNYARTLLAYISGDHHIHNKQRAALQFREVVQDIASNKYLWSELLFNYFAREDELAKILIIIFQEIPFKQGDLQSICQHCQSTPLKKIRGMKLVATYIKHCYFAETVDVIEASLPQLLEFMYHSMEGKDASIQML